MYRFEGLTIQKFNTELYKKILGNWDKLAKPLDGLGEFEKTLSLIGTVQNNEKIDLDHGALVVFISDNGIIEEGVSQSDYEVTYQVACALGRGESTVCHMAKSTGVDVIPVNVGMKYEGEIKGVINKSVASGTNNFLKEPAMSKIQMMEAIQAGFDTVEELKKAGYTMILLGEMGIGNTTTSAAVISALMGIDGMDVCSRGAGLSDVGLNKKISVVNEAVSKYSLKDKDPLTVLMTVGGFDIAALTGAVIAACLHNISIVSDGFITGTAAYIASLLYPQIKDYICFSHRGRERGMEPILDWFNSKPVIDANMALGEGTGACIFHSAARTAHAVYKGGTLFQDINIDNYKRF